MGFKVESDRALSVDVGGPATELLLPGVSGAGTSTDPYIAPYTSPDVLLAMGRATAAIFSPAKALFEVSAQWAIFRWFWAFEPIKPAVELSSAEKEIRNHHRTAFSEAAGLAVGLLVTEHLAGHAVPPGIWTGGPMLVDVDSHVDSGARPDLVVFFGAPGAPGGTYVLEAKGNSQGRARSVKQLAKGIPQVLAAEGRATRLVVGAAVPGPNFQAFAISVPEHSEGASAPPTFSLDELGESALRQEIARIRRFAGVADALDLELGGPRPIELPDAELELVGRQLQLRGADYSAEITVGVERNVFEGMAEVSTLEALHALRAGTLQRWQSRLPGANINANATLLEEGRSSTLADDGCMLDVRLL